MSSYYGGTITVAGRDLITSLIAGETIEFTKVVVGSGKMPEGVEPIDMTDLVAPVAQASSTVPVVENGVLYMTVEYRNDMNGGLSEGFWLNEFGVYAKTDKTEEVLLYYATLGDSPQPVNAYTDNRYDIRRYPISIALEVDAEIQVTYNPGAFITAEDAQQQIEALVSQSVEESVDESIGGLLDNVGTNVIKEITIPTVGWEFDEDPSDIDFEYPYKLDLSIAEATEEAVPVVSIHKGSIRAAVEAGLCPSANSLDGVLRFWSNRVPEEEIDVTIVFLSNGYIGEGGGGGGSYVMPIASKDQLGAVKIGENITVQEDGTISVTPGVIDEDAVATSDEADSMLDEIFADEDGQ